ncbi:MAG: GRP family sugar transporter [Patescibacteria group bacterium]|mgnify:CR=1 FL=1
MFAHLGTIFALIGHTLYAAVHVADRLVVTSAMPNEYVYAFWVGFIPVPAAIVLLPFLAPVSATIVLISLASGAAFTIGNVFHFRAMRHMEVTRVAPFIGAMVPIFTYLLAWYYFGEALPGSANIGFGLLVFGSVIIGFSYPATKRTQHVAMTIADMCISALFYAGCFVLAKYAYDNAPFIQSFTWGLVGSGIPAIAMLFSHGFRKALKEDSQRKRTKFEWLLLSNKVFSAMAFILLHLATALTSATLVQSIQGLQYMLVLVIALYMGRNYPSILNENLRGKHMFLAVIAIACILAGLGLLGIHS